MFVILFVHRYGWIAGELRDNLGMVCGLRFTQDRRGAKHYPVEGLVTDDVCYYIEWQLKCSYDRVRLENAWMYG